MKRFQTILLGFVFGYTSAQCPIDESDFADGGTFSGNCNISVGLHVTITGSVTWSSGALNVLGGSGNIIVANGGHLTISGGSITTNDDGNSNAVPDGLIEVNSGGIITVEEAASLISYSNITVDGTINLDGALTSENSRIIVNSGGLVAIGSTGSLYTNGVGDNEILGTIDIYGLWDTAGDVEINGGLIHIFSGGSLVVGDPVAPPIEDEDMLVYNGGTLIVDVGGDLQVEDDIVGGDDPPPYTASEANFIINGDITAGGDLIVFDTAPDSQLTGAGSVTVDGSFSDSECPDIGDFCSCGGGGETCSSVLPVELIEFFANAVPDHIAVEWTTATETNNDFFTLYHSIDGVEFEKIATIVGHGTSSQINQYSFNHANPPLGINYYQLLQTDFDGTESKSEIIYAHNSSIGSSLQLFPNPIRNGETITLRLDAIKSGEQTLHAILTDLSGKVIDEVELLQRGESSNYEFQLSLGDQNRIIILNIPKYKFQERIRLNH